MPRGSTALIVALVVLIVLTGGVLLYVAARNPATNTNAGTVTTNTAKTNAAAVQNANEDAALGVTPAPTTVNSSGDLVNAETSLNANLDADDGDSGQLNDLTNGF